MPAEPILGTDDLQTYAPLAGLGALALAAGIPTGLTSWGGDLYYNGVLVISTNFTNPGMIAVWDGSWAIPLVTDPSDSNTFIGGGGNNRQPQTGPQAIDFDGTTYAIGAYDVNGNTSVYLSNSPKTSWTLLNLNTDATFDAIQALKWIPRLGLWIAVGDQIWSSPTGAAAWTSRNTGDSFYQQLYDDGTTLWAIGATEVWKSTDGLSWTGTTLGSNYPYSSTNAQSPLWYSARLKLWFGLAAHGGSSPDPHYGIVTASDPSQNWAYIYTSPNDPPTTPSESFSAIAEVGDVVYFIGTRVTALGPTSEEAIIGSSADGLSVSVATCLLPEVPSFPFSSLTAIIGAPDNLALGISLKNANAIDEFTNTYSTDGGGTLTNKYLDGEFHQIIGPTLTPIPPPGADEMLGLQIGVGFHRFAKLPGTGQLRSIKEVQDPISGKLAILASDMNGQIWRLVPKYVSGAITLSAPVSTTQELPTPEQVGVELRDTQKVFKYLWIEGTNLSDYIVNWSIDGGTTFLPPIGQTVRKGLNRVGATGTQIIFKFTRTSDVARYSLMSYYKLFWDVLGKAAQ